MSDKVLVLTPEEFEANREHYVSNVDKQPIRIKSPDSPLTITIMGLAEPRRPQSVSNLTE